MCGCGRTQQQYQVKMPDGEVKVYSSVIAAKAKLKGNPGAVALNFDPNSV